MNKKNELALVEAKLPVTQILGLPENQWKDCTFGGEAFAMKVPTTRELIRMESRNTTANGEVDLSSYMVEIVDMLLPKRQLGEIAEIAETITINTGEREIVLSNVTAKVALDIINNASKLEIDKKDPKKMVLRPNTEEMIESIFALTDKELDIDNFKYKEIKMIAEQFESALKVDTLMEMYNFFQKNFQA